MSEVIFASAVEVTVSTPVTLVNAASATVVPSVVSSMVSESAPPLTVSSAVRTVLANLRMSSPAPASIDSAATPAPVMMTSAPAPAITVSAPSPAVMLSAPSPVVILSAPPLPTTVSLAAPEITVSAPAPPVMLSAPELVVIATPGVPAVTLITPVAALASKVTISLSSALVIVRSLSPVTSTFGPYNGLKVSNNVGFRCRLTDTVSTFQWFQHHE